MRIGLQLYTVRDELARDAAGTLRTIAELGYEGVELYDGLRLPDLHGLEVVGRHIGFDAHLDDLDTDRVALAWIEPVATVEERDAAVARIVELAERVRASGRRFAFHNHWSEVPPLADGASLLDRLPDWIDLELDLGWAWFAGADPVELLERFRGRTPVVHAKDLRSREEHAFCAVGDGGVGYDALVPKLDDFGVEWLLAEQDEGADERALARSYEVLAA